MDQIFSGDRFGTCALHRADVFLRGLEIDPLMAAPNEIDEQYIDSWWL